MNPELHLLDEIRVLAKYPLTFLALGQFLCGEALLEVDLQFVKADEELQALFEVITVVDVLQV